MIFRYVPCQDNACYLQRIKKDVVAIFECQFQFSATSIKQAVALRTLGTYIR